MSTTVWNIYGSLLILLALAACQDQPRSMEELSGDKLEELVITERAVDLEDALGQILQLETDSLQIFLRESYWMLSDHAVGMDYDAAASLANRHGISLSRSWSNGTHTHAEFLIKKDAFSSSGEHRWDAVLFVTAENTRNSAGEYIPETIVLSSLHVVETINDAFAHLLHKNPYPEGSLFDLIMHNEEFQAQGKKWPILKRLSTRYGYHIFSRSSSEFASPGFLVEAECISANNGETGSSRMHYLVFSGLDPLHSVGGKWALSKGFVAADTLSEVFTRGGSYWGYP